MLNLSIRNKFALMCVSLSIISALVVAVWAYQRLTHESLAAVERQFRNEMSSLRPLLDNAFRYGERDLRILSRLPPIAGLGRALMHGGIDSIDDSTADQWKHRLATIFKSTLESRPHFFQIRLVGKADGGRELVRVERLDNNVVARTEDLQRKAGEQYFEPSLALQPGQIYYSDITLNREYGQLDPRRIPTLGFATPVTDENGNKYGFLMINLDYRAFMISLSGLMQTSYANYLIDGKGNYLVFDNSEQQARFVYSDIDTSTPAIVQRIAAVNQPLSSFYFTDDQDIEHIVVAAAHTIQHDTGALNILLAISAKTDVLLQPLREFQGSLIAGGALILVVCALVARFFSGWLMRPVYQSIDALGLYAQGELKKLPEVWDIELQQLSAANAAVLNELLVKSSSGVQALQKYQLVFDTVVDGLVSIDVKGNIQSINPAAEAIFGYDQGELIGENVNVLMPEPYHSEHDQYLRNYCQTGEKKIIGIGREVSGRRKDGSSFPLDLAVSEGSEDGRPFYIGLVRDISERKAKELQLHQTLAELKKSNQELDDFAYIASHDLREPLRGIQMHAQKLLRAYDKQLDGDGVRRLNRLNELAGRLQKLVGDLLFFSRLGRSDIAMEPADLNQVVEEVVAALQGYIQERNGVVKVLSQLPVINCDRVKLYSIFNNLITNGLKYNDCSERLVEIDYLPEVERKGVRYKKVILVRDNGIGIDEEFSEDIFRIFKRLNAEDKYGYGTGAGLTFVRKSVEMHGGRIWVESEPGSGSTFHFCLKTPADINYSANDDDIGYGGCREQYEGSR